MNLTKIFALCTFLRSQLYFYFDLGKRDLEKVRMYCWLKNIDKTKNCKNLVKTKAYFSPQSDIAPK